jgi:hypothetical protein
MVVGDPLLTITCVTHAVLVLLGSQVFFSETFYLLQLYILFLQTQNTYNEETCSVYLVGVVTGSVRADSQAASRVEQTLSEVASSLGSFIPQKQGPRQCWLLQVQIWMHIGTL